MNEPKMRPLSLKWYELAYEDRRALAKEGPFCPITGNKCLTDTWNLSDPPNCNCGQLVRNPELAARAERVLDVERKLGFWIEQRGVVAVVVYRNRGGCRPATDTELAMWKLLTGQATSNDNEG